MFLRAGRRSGTGTGTGTGENSPAGTDRTAADPDPGDVVVRLESVRRVYGTARNEVHALRGISLSFARGGFTSVMGPSGSGKSTFLHCAAGLDRPTAGRVYVGGTELGALDETALTVLRREELGFVFQDFNLVRSLTVEQNITLPLRLSRRRVDRAWLDDVVGRTGLGDRLRHRPAELSGGQQQRVAVARALIARPTVVFADEPTGALDLRTGREILALLRHAVDGLRQTVIMVTHDPAAASHTDDVLFLADGQLAGSLPAPTAAAVAERLARLGED
ncbi:ABC transporter ATP-binding protein [Streptomyces sp. NPDC056987]|uniref:ABC transporter ATP-binding protein n=1 Tax=Streptomyces sp. NPDC056987 TaxID=3345988 RepID=UPI00362C42F5